jgi:hypothetical protein
VGLDLNPLGKPKKGFEAEYSKLFQSINNLEGSDREKALKRWFEIQISPYETLNTPRIGIDDSATKWVLEQFAKNTDGSETEQEHIKRHYGVYLPKLSLPSDGIPVYSNSGFGIASIHSFRGQFLVDECSDIAGSKLIERLYGNCLSKDALALSNKFIAVTKEYAGKNNVDYVANLRSIDADEKSPEMNAHILFSFCKWLRFWSENGHGFEADY